jgi:hypothetical protein
MPCWHIHEEASCKKVKIRMWVLVHPSFFFHTPKSLQLRLERIIVGILQHQINTPSPPPTLRKLQSHTHKNTQSHCKYLSTDLFTQCLVPRTIIKLTVLASWKTSWVTYRSNLGEGWAQPFLCLIHIAKKLYYKILSAKFKLFLEIFKRQNFNQNVRKITKFLYIVQWHNQEYRKVS